LPQRAGAAAIMMSSQRPSSLIDREFACLQPALRPYT
jgi:ABC-type thiamine transport system ATPase subunit